MRDALLQAGSLVGGQIHWRSFSMDPTQSEPTPVYNGFGLRLQGAYVYGRIFSTGLFLDYTPGRVGDAKFLVEEVSFANAGLEAGLLIDKALSLTLRLAKSRYGHVANRTPDDVKGVYDGMSTSLNLSGIVELAKRQFLTVGVEAGVSRLVQSRGPEGVQKKRSLTFFGLSLGYAFHNLERRRTVSFFKIF